MPVTLYSNYIDYNGNRTFIAIGNCAYVTDCGDFQCLAQNCIGLTDGGETVSISGAYAYRYNCNCACG